MADHQRGGLPLIRSMPFILSRTWICRERAPAAAPVVGLRRLRPAVAV
jgi:hypothetical protein